MPMVKMNNWIIPFHLLQNMEYTSKTCVELYADNTPEKQIPPVLGTCKGTDDGIPPSNYSKILRHKSSW